MYEVFFAVAANRIIVDAKTNQISIIDLYEKLQTTGFPVAISKLGLLFYVSRQESAPVKCTPTLTCKCAGEEILTTALHVDFNGGDVARVVVTLDNLKIPKPGLMTASLSLDGNDWGQLDLEVQVAESDPNPHVVRSGKFTYRVT
jgi:hypothetical protein